MDLIEYNTSNVICRTKKSGNYIILSTKYGRIFFSKDLGEKLGLFVDRKTSFLQDKNNPKNWYIKFDTMMGIPIRKVNKITGRYYIQSQKLCNIIYESLTNEEGTNIRIPVSTEMHDEMYCLITSAIK